MGTVPVVSVGDPGEPVETTRQRLYLAKEREEELLRYGLHVDGQFKAWCGRQERIVAVGGFAGGAFLASCETYSINSHGWFRLPDMGTPRYGCAAVAVGNTVIAIGGDDGTSSLKSVEQFDFSSQRWVRLPDMHTARSFCAAGVLDGHIVVAGGDDGSKRLDSVEYYSFTTGTWTQLPPMPTARSSCAAGVLKSRFIVVGGKGVDEHSMGERTNVVEEFDAATGTWSTLPPLSGPRSAVAAVTLGDTLVVAGGYDGRTNLDVVETYSSLTNVWTALPPMSSKRSGCSAVTIGGHVVVMNGANKDNQCLETAEVFDPRARTWVDMPSMSSFRQFGAGCSL